MTRWYINPCHDIQVSTFWINLFHGSFIHNHSHKNAPQLREGSLFMLWYFLKVHHNFIYPSNLLFSFLILSVPLMFFRVKLYSWNKNPEIYLLLRSQQCIEMINYQITVGTIHLACSPIPPYDDSWYSPTYQSTEMQKKMAGLDVHPTTTEHL